MGQPFADPHEGGAGGPDAVNFCDQPAALSIHVEESEAEAPRFAEGTVKVASSRAPMGSSRRHSTRAGARRTRTRSSIVRARLTLRGHEWYTALPGTAWPRI